MATTSIISGKFGLMHGGTTADTVSRKEIEIWSTVTINFEDAFDISSSSSPKQAAIITSIQNWLNQDYVKIMLIWFNNESIFLSLKC